LRGVTRGWQSSGRRLPSRGVRHEQHSLLGDVSGARWTSIGSSNESDG
jgi:hypothetical protein